MLDQSENPIIPEPSDGEWINSEDDSDSDDDDCSEVRNQAKVLLQQVLNSCVHFRKVPTLN